MRSLISIVLIAIAVGLFFFAPEPGSLLGLPQGQSANFVFSALLLTLVGAAFVINNRRLESPLKLMTSWIATGAALMIGFSNLTPLLKLEVPKGTITTVSKSATVPSPELRTSASGGTFEIPAAQNGNFYTSAEINGEDIDVVIDTGATYVTLSYEDAEGAGLDPDNLSYTVPMRTANGVTMGALTELDDVSVGGISVGGVEAIVAEAGTLDITLLGMSYLSRISSFKVEGRQLVLAE
ncbi:MAG: retropepsin-like aspartic protease family protein [Hyphomicrobiales bacterium]